MYHKNEGFSLSLRETETKVKEWLKRILQDPLVNVLLKNSSLTEIQFETVLIDILAEEIAQSKLSYEMKRFMRVNKSDVSKGSYNRSLRQARKNIRRSVSTLLLLGYLDLVDTPNLLPFIDLSKNLEKYKELYRMNWKASKVEKDQRSQNRLLEYKKMIQEGLEKLSTLKRV